MKEKNFKKQGFTLAETMIVMTVMSFIIILTVANSFNMDKIREKKLLSLSREFYGSTQTAYQHILMKHSRNMDSKTLGDANGDDEINHVDLKDYFIKYMGAEEYSCSALKLMPDSVISDYKDEISCGIFHPNIIAGFKFDPACKMEVKAKEYLNPEDKTHTTYNNNCGYIIYGLMDSQGVFGVDTFTIAIGKTRIR